MDGHPGLESVIVVLVVPKIVSRSGKAVAESSARNCGAALPSSACAGDQDGAEEPQRVHQEMALTALHALAAVIPALRAADLGGLDRLPLNTDRAGVGSRPAATRVCSRHTVTTLSHVPSSRHWAT